jgi:hypothetical protein
MVAVLEAHFRMPTARHAASSRIVDGRSRMGERGRSYFILCVVFMAVAPLVWMGAGPGAVFAPFASSLALLGALACGELACRAIERAPATPFSKGADVQGDPGSTDVVQPQSGTAPSLLRSWPSGFRRRS